MSITYTKRPYTLQFLPNAPADVSPHTEIHLAGNTGLGYYIDPALPVEEQGIHMELSVNGGKSQKMVIERPWSDEDKDRYVPMHILTSRSFGLWFYSEEEVQAFIEQVAPLLDWNGDVEHLQSQEGWKEVSRIMRGMLFNNGITGIELIEEVPTEEERAHALATMSRAQLKAYKEKYQLLLLKGKLLTPAEYPCKCEKANSVDCADDRNLRRDYCGCRCHTYGD